MYKTALARQRRNKRIYKKILKYFVSKKFEEVSYKFAAILLLVVMNAVMFYVPITNSTNAFYNDSEISEGNIFQASALDVNIYPENFSETMLPGNATTTTISLSKFNLEDLDFKYFAISTTTGSDSSACDYITISASSSPQNISGLFSSFVSATSTPVGLVLWDFTFTVADDAPPGICNFKIIYTAWQTNFEESSSGFNDIDEMTGSITIGQVAPVVPDVVLNEFLPRPNGVAYGFDFGNDNSDMPKGEWVELYNNGSESVDLTGWYLADSTPGNGNETPIEGAHILVASPIIPAHGWLVVYTNKAVYNNPGDTVRLFDDNGTQVDSYSYGIDPTFCNMEPTSGDNNTSVSSGSCNSSNVPGNKSFARIPDGTGDWVDPIPTPGEPNKVEEVEVEIPALIYVSNEGEGDHIIQEVETNNLAPLLEIHEIVALPPFKEEDALEEPVVVPAEEEVIAESEVEEVVVE